MNTLALDFPSNCSSQSCCRVDLSERATNFEFSGVAHLLSTTSLFNRLITAVSASTIILRADCSHTDYLAHPSGCISEHDHHMDLFSEKVGEKEALSLT